MDGLATGGIRGLEGMPRARHYPGFSHRRGTLCSRHGRQSACCRSQLQDDREVVIAYASRSLSGDIVQPAGRCCGNVYALPVVSPRGAIHPSNRS